MQVATQILEQLGGHRFVAMTGAKQFVGGDRALQFSIGRGATNKANKVRVTLAERIARLNPAAGEIGAALVAP